MTIQTRGMREIGSVRLLRLGDVADRLAVSRSMVWKLVALGHLPAIRIGRAIRVRPDDLDHYLAGPARQR